MASSTIEPSTRTLDQPRGGVDWLRLLAGSLGEAVVAVDDGGALIAFNDGAARLFGVDPSFERPQRWDTLRGRLLAGSSGSCPDGEDPLATALHGTIRERREMFVRRADGSGTPVDVSSGPLKDADGRVVGGVAVLADATLRKNTEADIRRLRRAFHVFNVTSRELGRATCASQVYDAACRAAVEDGGFRMAWVGVVD